MNKIKYISCALILVMAAGCNDSIKTALTETKYVTPGGTPHLPLRADIIIEDNKTTGNFSCKTDYGLEYAKTQAVAAALKKSNADILYEPQYLIENTGHFFNVEVSGHAAHYKNFRTASSPGDTSASAGKLNVVQPLGQIFNTKSKNH